MTNNMGELITKLRKEKNMTQQELAEKLNITDKAVSKWERGMSCPDIATIPKLAETLGVGSDELLSGIKKNDDKKSVSELVTIILKSVGLAMGVVTFVLLLMDAAKVTEALKFLSISTICFGMVLLKEKA